MPAPPAPAEPDDPRFYDRHWERMTTKDNPAIARKAKLVLSMIPAETRTIVDVGCGDGHLTHELAERYDVLAVDRSAVPLARLRCRTLQASADDLPLPDRSCDLVFASEVLEHLPAPILAKATREIARVADSHVFITVPHRENLRKRFARCPTCKLEFHVDGHLHSFDGPALDALFPDFERIDTQVGGNPEPATYPLLERTRQHAANRWWVWSDSAITCPGCGEERFAPARRNALHRTLDRALDRATEALNGWTGNHGSPYWLLALYRRRDRPTP